MPVAGVQPRQLAVKRLGCVQQGLSEGRLAGLEEASMGDEGFEAAPLDPAIKNVGPAPAVLRAVIAEG